MMSAYGRSHSSVDKTHNGDAVGLIGVPDAPFSLSNTTPAARRAQPRTRGGPRRLKVTALQRGLRLGHVPSRRRLIRDSSTCGLSESGPTPAPSPRLASYLDPALPTIIFIAICLFSKTWVGQTSPPDSCSSFTCRSPLPLTVPPESPPYRSVPPPPAMPFLQLRTPFPAPLDTSPENAITRIRALGTIRTPRICGIICRNCLPQDERTSSGDEHALSRDGLCLCSDHHLSLISLQ